ncbi:hypothetical protein [Methylobacter sp. YRD-M1]|uniref:hypothetical protein n=1 Tax=Methylobacter sp. YRD-M1 TaxID=2911520 RepID=UPI00227D3D2C|nr:hypothetical protein [Methylobacter sp. YRD-M1]WAK02648.1 hypothetical protein LZ558_02325 [Methylobacter sp. YRD-M1]
MKTFIFTRNLFFAALTGTVLALSVAGCSDDKEEQKPASAEVHNPFDHSHDVVVTDVQKHTFEHQFADQCVERELKTSVNKEYDKKRLSEACMCIATFLMKDLTADEAKKFITEHKNTQSLVIKYESAAYHCLQEKAQPKGPQLFNRKQ